MPGVAEFKANPMQFFRDNIVLTSYGPNNNLGGGPYDMGMEDGWCSAPGANQGWTGVGPTGRPMPIVTVTNFPNAIGPTFQAYWCPYQAGSYRQAFLAQAADYMFTAKMNGCTFAAGGALPFGSRMVFHANQTALTKQQKEQLQYDMLSGATGPLHGDPGARIMGPSAYGSDGVSGYTQATTFGLLGGQTWTFHSLVTLFDFRLRRMYWHSIIPV